MNLLNRKKDSSGTAAMQGWLSGKWKEMKANKLLYLMLIPFVLWHLLFWLRPLNGLQIGFKDYNLFAGMADSPWVGLENFKDFLTGPYVGRLFKNTFLIGFYSLVFSFPVPILLALFLNEIRKPKFRQTLQTAMFMPHFISAVIICGILINILSPSGLVNNILGWFGIESTYFLAEPKYFRTIYIIMGIWRQAGYKSIMFLAAIAGIDQQLYEACVIDGGGKLRQIWHVTIPGILPTIVIMFVMAAGHIMSVGYETIILLYQPITYETADVISTYTYRIGLSDGEYGFATAVGLFNSLMSLFFVTVSNFVSKKLTGSGLW